MPTTRTAPAALHPAAAKVSHEIAMFAGGQCGRIDNFSLGRLKAGGLTVVGGREANEDGLLINSRLIVVADGMGGHGDGEKASHSALRTLDNEAAGSFDFHTALAAAGRQMRLEKSGGAMAADAGTAIVGGYFIPETNKLQVAHIGDSRAYRFRDGLGILTIDDLFGIKNYLGCDFSEVAAIRQLGRDAESAWQAFQALKPPLTPEQSKLFYQIAQGHGSFAFFASTVEKSLGYGEAEKEVTTITSLEWQPGDIYLFMSDGVHGYVDYDPLAEAVKANRQKSPGEIAQAVQDTIADPQDNITVGVVVC
jgi:serine/threonine protein phosphatase PrpC